MLNKKAVLVVGSHPDDIEYGVMGTLLKYRKANPDLVIYGFVASSGGMNDVTSGPSRIDESSKALLTLQPIVIQWEEKEGIDYNFYHYYVHSLETILIQHKIDMVIAPTIHDTHQDHRLAHEIVVTALRRKPVSVWFYSSVSVTLDFKPQVFVNISDNFRDKCSSLENHNTQNMKDFMSKKAIETFNSGTYSFLQGIDYCEAFEVGQWIC
jgi:LmbE family N-acetylglucosaminyl deacetylase